MQFVDGVRDLPDLFGGVHRDRADRPGFPTPAHLFDFAGEFGVRDFQRTVAQGRSGRTSDRATRVTSSRASRIAASTSAASRMAVLR